MTKEQHNEDRRAIENLMLRYVHLANAGEYKQWSELFDPENCVYKMTTHGNHSNGGMYLWHDDGIDALHERVAYWLGMWQVSRAKSTRLLSNVDIYEISDNEAKARSNVAIYRTVDTDGLTRFHTCAEYNDRFVKRDGEWKFAERQVILDCDTLPANFSELV